MAAIGAWVRVVLPQVVGSTLPEGPSSPAKPAPAVQAVTAMAPAGGSMALTYLGDLLSGTAAQAAQQVPTGWLACVDQPADHGPFMHTHNPAACVAQDLLSGAAHSRFPVAAVVHLLITLYTPAAYLPEACCSESCTADCPIGCTGAPLGVPSCSHCGPAGPTCSSVACVPALNLCLPCMLQQGPPQDCLS